MKILLMAVLFFTTSLALAQDELTGTNENKSESPSGTYVKPTKQQLKTVPKTSPAKKKTESTTVESSEESDTSAVDEKPVIEKKKTEVSVKEESAPTSKPHLFGLHADLNVPHLINYGLDYWHSSRWFSISLNGGSTNIPANILKSAIKDVDDPSVKISNLEGVARLHVFSGSFYVGLGYGNHSIEGAGNKSITITTPVPGSATVRLTDKIKSNYVTPHIGWLWKLDMGLTFGFDVGYMAPSGATVDLKEEALTPLPGGASLADFQATPEYQQARKEIVDASEQIGKKGVPYLALLRIGYMF